MDLSRTWRDRRHRTLMSMARSGHEKAFRRLYGELYPPVMRFVEARVRPTEEAEDVVAGIFHRWLTRMDQFDPQRGSVWTWTFTLARNACIDHARASRPTESIEPHVSVLDDQRADPLDRLVLEEEGGLLHGRLCDETPEIREMFALHFRDGLRYGEIARVLDISEAAVKQRFARTLRRLRAEGRDPRKGDEHESLEWTNPSTLEDPA